VEEEIKPVEPSALKKLIGEADRIVISESVFEDARVLFTSGDKKDITEFGDALTIVVPEGLFHDMCLGSTTICLYRGGVELASITNHHANSIRCSLWTSDVQLLDPDKWIKWFDARKITGPREEYEEMVAREKRHEASDIRWIAAMPNSIRRLWEVTLEEQLSSPLTKVEQSTYNLLRNSLAQEFPEISKRILALLTWYGSGDGPWSGFPAYESIAEDLLLDFRTTEIVSAVQSTSLTEQQLEGTARLFGGWNFSKRKPKDLKLVPATLKKTLLEHSLKSTAEDKIDRAKSAFGQR